MSNTILDEHEWFIWGQSSNGRLVDIANHHGTVISCVPYHQAQQICDEHNQTLDYIRDWLHSTATL